MLGPSQTSPRRPAGPRLALTELEDRSVPANTDLSVAYDPNPPPSYTPGLSVE